ncbi:hypothetical protein [Vibrio crassostreae]|uniref:hypothetical protein n=1 Tax=Vibrio crassostreae TaxID=246167 RepID=UPI00104AFD09|nr:hypothetical protein [Vibrio crassostreae]
MAMTVNGAFNHFMLNYVNLDYSQVTTARSSRNWLVEQLNGFPEKYDDFPSLYTSKHMGFGSFARSTKKRELDDIDHLICMNADGVTYSTIGDTVYMRVPDNAQIFKGLIQTDGTYLSSIKVVNRFVKYLQNIPQYSSAAIKRNHEAATLKLTSYTWNFDIVPCFLTADDMFGNSYYLIPDGQGNWKKTDPRKDKERTTRVNTARDGNVLKVIRAIKYWSKFKQMPNMGSYLIENMILDYYETHSATSWVDLEVRDVLFYISNAVYNQVQDPKGIQGNINCLTYEERSAISAKALGDSQKAQDAYNNENTNVAYAISKWREIFGSNFPTYG